MRLCTKYIIYYVELNSYKWYMTVYRNWWYCIYWLSLQSAENHLSGYPCAGVLYTTSVFWMDALMFPFFNNINQYQWDKKRNRLIWAPVSSGLWWKTGDVWENHYKVLKGSLQVCASDINLSLEANGFKGQTIQFEEWSVGFCFWKKKCLF